MICILQRVKNASVIIENKTFSKINSGLLVFACAEPTDTLATIEKTIKKIISLRIFNDTDGKMNLNINQANGELLLVSQFTLAADTRRGNRPGFSQAAPPDQANQLYDLLLTQAKKHHNNVQSGQFGADMQIHLVNDGPVTIPLHIQ